MLAEVGAFAAGVARRCRTTATWFLIAVGVIGLVAVSTGVVYSARLRSGGGERVPATTQKYGAESRSVPQQAAAPSIAGVAELRRMDGHGALVDAFAYPMPSSQSAFDWPHGSGAGGISSGVAQFAWPHLASSPADGGVGPLLAVANVVGKPGFTDFAIMLYDQNALMDYVCLKLNERQVEYIDLDTWGYINRGWTGSAIVSAIFWEHDAFDPADGRYLRNLVGLAGVALDSNVDSNDASGDFSSGSVASPLMPALGAPYGPDLSRWGPPCPPRGPWQPPPTPTYTPQAGTPSPTVTASPTATPLLPPPYAPGSPEVHLPALGRLRADDQCRPSLRVQNVGLESAQALVILWDQPSQCRPDCAGPSETLCTGLIKPGSTWEIALPTLPMPARSATVFSFTDQLLSDIGVDVSGGVQDGPVSEYMCDTVPARAVDSCDGYIGFKQSYDSGTDFYGVPMARAWGAPLVVQVHRSCQDAAGIDVTVESSYEGASGADLGYAAQGERYAYSLPHIGTVAESYSSIVHIQNVGDTCATIEFETYESSVTNAPCEPAVVEVLPPIGPGGSVSIDMANGRENAFEGSGVIRSDVPLAIVVDDVGHTTLTSHAAKATSLRDMHGQPLLAAQGSVAFAPMLVKNYQGWTSRLHIQNLGAEESWLKVTILDRSGDEVSVGWFGPVCSNGALTIDLESMGGIPHVFLGTARVESYATKSPDATPWVPAPTSTSERSVVPTPTRTPCAGTCPPTYTATPRPPTVTPARWPSDTPDRGPTATRSMGTPAMQGHGVLYLPMCIPGGGS